MTKMANSRLRARARRSKTRTHLARSARRPLARYVTIVPVTFRLLDANSFVGGRQTREEGQEGQVERQWRGRRCSRRRPHRDEPARQFDIQLEVPRQLLKERVALQRRAAHDEQRCAIARTCPLTPFTISRVRTHSCTGLVRLQPGVHPVLPRAQNRRRLGDSEG